MSEKKWKIDSRVPHKYRGGRRGKGSEFPRHGMNEYEGERLSMSKHRLSKHKTMSYNKGNGWASLHEKHIEGLLNKYLCQDQVAAPKQKTPHLGYTILFCI